MVIFQTSAPRIFSAAALTVLAEEVSVAIDLAVEDSMAAVIVLVAAAVALGALVDLAVAAGSGADGNN